MVFWSQPFKIWLHQSWIKTFIIFVSISRPKVIRHLDTFQILKEVPFSLTKSILFIGLKIESGRIRLKAWISFKQLLYTTVPCSTIALTSRWNLTTQQNFDFWFIFCKVKDGWAKHFVQTASIRLRTHLLYVLLIPWDLLWNLELMADSSQAPVAQPLIANLHKEMESHPVHNLHRKNKNVKPNILTSHYTMKFSTWIFFWPPTRVDLLKFVHELMQVFHCLATQHKSTQDECKSSVHASNLKLFANLHGLALIYKLVWPELCSIR